MSYPDAHARAGGLSDDLVTEINETHLQRDERDRVANTPLQDPTIDAWEKSFAASDANIEATRREVTRAGLVTVAVTIADSVTGPTVRIRCLVCDRAFGALRRSAKTCCAACRQRLSRTQRAATPPFPPGPFDLIYADPPLDFATFSERGQGRSPSRHYATMDMDSICRLPIQKITAPDAGLAIWVYGPRLPQTLEIIRRWGFTFKSDLLTWVKTTPHGKWAFGTGYYTRKNTEQLLYATRGRALKVVDRAVRQGFFAKRREHSRKPDEAAEALERLFGPLRRIELFARRRRPGWAAWGNQLLEDELLEDG